MLCMYEAPGSIPGISRRFYEDDKLVAVSQTQKTDKKVHIAGV